MSFAAFRPRVPRVIRDARATAHVLDVVDAPPQPLAYVGLATRAIGFGIDAAIIDLVALSSAAITALAFSVLDLPAELKSAAIAIGAVLFVLWGVGYFVFFWSTTGQTPGARVMRFRVCAAAGGAAPLLPRRALLRFIGLVLAALPLFAGYLMILVDNRRRGLQDYLARTVVVEHHDDASMRRRDRRA
jgi:uncharacterized RDD family membrane protein YckC